MSSLKELQAAMRRSIMESKASEGQDNWRLEGGVRDDLPPEQTQCPQCGVVYVLEMPRGQGTAEQREQHITGICSTSCWEKFLGPEPDY